MIARSFYRINPEKWFFRGVPAVHEALQLLTEKTSETRTTTREFVRQWVLHELSTAYNYPQGWLDQGRITIEDLVQIGALTHKVDILVKNQYGDPFIVIKTQSPAAQDDEFLTAESQLKASLTANPSVTVGMITDGTLKRTRVLVKTANPDDFNLIADLPRYDSSNLGQGVQLTPDMCTARVTRKRTRLKPLTSRDVGLLFRCHSVIRDIDGFHPDESLDELCKLIYMKIWDERNTILERKDAAFAFQVVGGNVEEVASNMHSLYQIAQNEDLRIYGQRILDYGRSRGVFRAHIRLSSNALFQIVQLLQNFSLIDSSADIKGMAFQQVLNAAIRSGMGQYFTPEPVVRMVVGMLAPSPRDLILDPFCGSGHFLTLSLEFVLTNYSQHSNKHTLHEFAFFHLHGIEKSERMVRIAMTDMLLHGDGHSNIRNTDALLGFDNYPDIQALGGPKSKTPEVFDLVMTNPPFGSLLTGDTLQKMRGQFNLIAKRDVVPLEVLGLERSLQFLRPGGRLAIVLPESILNTRQMHYVRDYILQHTKVLAIVSLPPQTFMPFQGVGKASVLILEKRANPIFGGLFASTDTSTYDVFMAIAHHVGYDGTNRPDPIDDLPIIGDMYKRYLAGDRKDLGPLCFTVDSSLLNSSFSAVSHAPIMETGTWPTMPLTSLCHDIFNGATPARAKYTQTGHRVLKVRDLTNEGLDWDVGERAFVESAFFSKHLRQRIQVGDILITAAAHHPSYIGKKVDIVDWIPEEYSKGVLATAEILVIRPNTQLIDPLYLLMYLRTEQGYQALQSCVTGQTAHIYPRDVGKIMIPLPPNEIKTKLRPAFEELESSLELRRKFKAAHHHSKSLFELGLPCQDRPNTIKDEGTDKIP